MKKKNPAKPVIAAAIAFAAAAVLWCAIFHISLIGVIIGLAVCALIAFIVYNMAKGVDTGKQAPAQKKFEATGNPEVDSLIREGQELLGQIRAENRQIPDEKLTQQIDHVEETANGIFEAVAEEPSRAPKIRRFMKYYLPTTLKMLTNYRKIDQGKITGEDAEKAKQKIYDMMNMVEQAFDKQRETVYQDSMMDITTDIEVLETMFRQDGLIDSGLHGNDKQND